MYASNFREIARNALRGKWKKMAWLTFLAALLGAGSVTGSSGVSFPDMDYTVNLGSNPGSELMRPAMFVIIIASVLTLWLFFMGSIVRVGQNDMNIRLLDGETPRAGMLFPKGIYGKTLGMNFMRSLFVTLWTLLLIIPGIIASYSYSMADYLLATHPEMGAMEALSESKKRMKGRKWNLFCLELSFIGWELLSLVPVWISVIVMAIVGEVMDVFANANAPSISAILTLFGIFCIGGIICAIGLLFVQVYMNAAIVAFFQNVDRGAEWKEEAREGEQYARTAYTDDSAAWKYEKAAPHFAQPAPAEPVLTADETVAKDVFLQHKCSRILLEQKGILEEYEKLNASAISEARWKREYADALMRRFDQESEMLDNILALCVEYGMDDLANRALQRIDRHIRQQTLPDEQILDMCRRICPHLHSKNQLLDMLARLEARLCESAPSGSWQQTLSEIRSMCE